MGDAQISVQFLRHLANCIELTGRHVDPLLQEFGLKKADLDEREAMIALRDFLAIFERAAEYVNNPHFGLQAGRLVGSDSLGPLSFLFLSAPTLGDAFRAFVRFLDTMQQSSGNAFVVKDGIAAFQYSIANAELGIRRQDAEYSIGATYSLARNYCAGRFSLKEVHFEHQQAGSYQSYRDFFGCDVFFEQPVNSLRFSATNLNRSGQTLSPELFPILVDHFLRRSEETLSRNDTETEVERWLLSADMEKPLLLTDAASALGMSHHVLRRRLQERGMSWRRDCVTRRKIEAAKRLLQESNRSIADVAVSLGYSESASFIRAFKTQCGETPARFRKQHLR